MKNDNSVHMQVIGSDDVPLQQVIMIKPTLCKPWHLSNRDIDNVTEESCSNLIESIESYGQQVPVLIRTKDNSEEYELICGVRRLFSCNYLGINIKATIVNISDKEALVAMDAENRQREDISPYERACDYKRWIESGIYNSHGEIIAALGVKKSWFSQLIALAELDRKIVDAFGHPANLKLKWGYNLQATCKNNPRIEIALLHLAKELTGQSLAPGAVYRRFKNILVNEDKFNNKHAILITDKNENEIFEVKYSNSGSPRFVFNNSLSDSLLEKIINAAKRLIEENEE